MSARKRLSPAVAALLMCVAVGCNKAPYDLAEVSGRVTLDDKPFTGATIMFYPAVKDSYKVGKPAFARLEPDGTFELSTYGTHDGAVVGPHRVTLYQVSDEEDNLPQLPRQPKVEKKPKSRLDSWGEIRLPGNWDVVAGQENSFEIKLTTAILAKRDHRED